MIFRIITLLLIPVTYTISYQQGFSNGFEAGECNTTKPADKEIDCWMRLYNNKYSPWLLDAHKKLLEIFLD